jgi:uncharacterized protein YyaL (SSP411 family)
MPNRLQHSESPYLQQHKNNPVDWYPWCQEAFTKARQENKPVLISIGYSACHWCHVMAHESFEDPETAQVMNQHFVNIKVDREERPDLDHIYQISHQILNQRPGGWPLNVFLNPEDQTPFFSATYFPEAPRHGLPAFKDVLLKMAELYQQQNDNIKQQNEEIHSIFKQLFTTKQLAADNTLNDEPIELALDQLEEEFDGDYGGFGNAPKFPSPCSLQRLLRRQHDHPKDKKAMEMLTSTLDAMARGGIYDQVGGGFFRYSVDDQWSIPHFEKMLYDNGLLLAIYSRTYAITAKPIYKKVVEETAAWLLNIMQTPQHGFACSLDADTCDTEGQYYYWDKTEIAEIANAEEWHILDKVFDLKQAPNFNGHYHLAQSYAYEDLSPAQQKQFNQVKQKLLEKRYSRIQPQRDDKILTAWNALTIRGLSIAGSILNKAGYINTAQKSLAFIKQNLWHQDRLWACFKDKKAYQLGFLDDYAFLLDSLLFTLQAKWSNEYFDWAKTLVDILLTHFQDQENGGFYFTSDEHENLFKRPKTFMDTALPAGNGVIAQALNYFGHLTGNTQLLQVAEKTLKANWQDIQNYPASHHTLIHALEEYLNSPLIVVIRGESNATMEQWRNKLIKENYNPHRLILCIPKNQALPKELSHYKAHTNTVAYVCHNFQCQPPIEDAETLLQQLKAL